MNNQQPTSLLKDNSLKIRRRRATSTLFRQIEIWQAPHPWGNFLDAGAGVNSALWVSRLPTKKWVCVTGDPSHANQIRGQLNESMRPGDQLIVGNWCESDFLQGAVFDTVLADYLLGAIEGFAPYFQGQLFARLRPHVGHRLYVIGLDPYILGSAPSNAGRIVKAIGRLRDCCLLLAGETPYREYPAEWAIDSLLSAGFKIDHMQRFPNRYGARWIHAQLDMACRRLPKLNNQNLAAALAQEIENLRTCALQTDAVDNGLRHGADYIIACST